MPTLVVILAAASSGLFIYSLASLLFSEERRVHKRMHGLSDYEVHEAGDMEPLVRPFGERVLKPASARAGDGLRGLFPAGQRRALVSRLEQAGRQRPGAPEEHLAIQLIWAAIVGVGTALIVFLATGDASRAVFGAILGAVAGFLAPSLRLSMRISERKLAIRRALPDMLDMLTISVEAGLGFDAAVSKLVTNSTGPLAEEFGRMLNEVQAGISRQDAFRHLAARTDVPELSTFAMSMIQADVFGISVSNVLRTQAREMRVKRRQYAEEVAQKAPVKIVFPLVLCILPATLIVILGPAMVSIGRAFGLLD
ncbi:MAG: type II secretion system F family protein [Coriobacteriia bacterium]